MAWRHGLPVPGTRQLAAETPVAFSYDGVSHAVMLATPDDLEDFARGFSLTEGIIDAPGDILDLDVRPVPRGVLLRIWLRASARDRLAARRRHMAGPAGCGLCGIESLDEAVRSPPVVSAKARFTAADVQAAIAAMAPAQRLGADTRATHAAGLWHSGHGLVALREDVGRHNALDKLAGAVAPATAAEGIIVLTSRVSVELVQKAARIGAGVLAAVSAPTTLALQTAEQAGITLVGIARDDGFELFTRPERVRPVRPRPAPGRAPRVEPARTP